jgi:hypothetical protein
MTKDVLLWVCNVMPFGDATAQEVDDLQSEMERREKWDRDFTKKATDTRLAFQTAETMAARKRKKFLSEDEVNALTDLAEQVAEAGRG